MKTRRGTTRNIITATALMFVFAGCANQTSPQQTEEDGKLYPYDFDSAKIEYELKGNVEGTITVYVEGDKSSHETTATTAEGEEIHTKLIDLGDTLYQFNLTTKEGQKAPNPIYDQLRALSMDEREGFLTKLAVGAPDEGTTPQPTEQRQIAGQSCDLYNLQGIGEICLWNSIPLYSSITIPEQSIDNSNTATSVQINAAIPEGTFDIPSDITITEV